MPTQCSRDLFGFARVEGRQVEAAFDGGDAISDAGALLLGATGRAIGLVTGSRPVSIMAGFKGRWSTPSRAWSRSGCRHRVGL